MSMFFKNPVLQGTTSLGRCGFSCSENTFLGHFSNISSASLLELQCNAIPPRGRLYAKFMDFNSSKEFNFSLIAREDFHFWASLILSTTMTFPHLYSLSPESFSQFCTADEFICFSFFITFTFKGFTPFTSSL